MNRIRNEDSSLHFTRKVLITVGTTIPIVLLLLVSGYVAQMLVLIFAGILLAILLKGLAELLRRLTGLSNGWSVGIVLLLIAVLMVLTVWISSPPIAAQVSQLSEELPKAASQILDNIRKHPWGERLLRQAPGMNELGEHLGSFYRQVSNVFRLTLGAAGSLILVLFVGLYLAFEPQLYIDGVIRLFPVSHRPRAKEVLESLGESLRWWLVGRFVSMAIIGLMTALGLWILGIRLAFILGIFAAILTFVPYVGPVISAVPAILLGTLSKPLMGLYVALLYTVIQIVESYIVTPIVQRKAVSLPPVFTLVIQIVFSILIGVTGLIVATPAAVALLVLVKMVYVEGVLENPRKAVVPE
ncbi:MAG: AI-2E family transporter [Deltaproteobacteria bacterium HGW-Deltaproteobacteria-15]|nr:MAG: AI-2E family transporter [Deltaproteobacteria bacterium HGW-Deltaproteobacteria-15]